MPDTPSSNFTVKEMLTEIVIPDLKVIKAALDQKAERRDVNDLEVRVAAAEAAQLVQRDIGRRVIDIEGTVRRLDNDAQGFPYTVAAKINDALRDYDNRVAQKSDARFSRRDKILLSVLGIIGAIATIISTVFMVLSATGGGA